MEKLTLYFKKGKTAYKITQKKYPKLSTYLKAKMAGISEDYIKHQDDPENFSLPYRVLEEKAMDSLMKELLIKTRSVKIYLNGIEDSDEILEIMGIGIYNERIFKANDPSMHTIKTIELEQKQKESEEAN